MFGTIIGFKKEPNLLNLIIMDTNRFKASHDFSNIQKNLSNNRRYQATSHSQQADMKNQNQESSKNGFVPHAQKTVKEVWAEIQEMNSRSRNKHKDDENNF